MVLADPKLTQAEADFLASIPDLFKSSRDEFDAAAAIIEKSLERRGWIVRCRLSRPHITNAQGIEARMAWCNALP